MFEARVQNGYVQDVLDVATAIDEEGVVHADDEGVQLSLVDPAGVAMTDARLRADAFEALSATDAQLGMNLERLDDVVSTTEGDAVSLTLDAETRKLEIADDILSYTMALIDPDSIRPEPDIPDLDFVAEVTLPTSELARGMKAAKMVGDTVDLCIVDGEFELAAAGDLDAVTFSTDEAMVAAASGDLADCMATFSREWLSMLVKAVPGSEVTLWLADEMPVVMEFEFADVSDADADSPEYAGEGTFAIAPRVDAR